MANEEKSIYEELAPFAKMVVVPGVSVGNLVYSNQQDLYSSSVFNPEPATGLVGANTQLQFFQGALGQSALTQGYAGGLLGLGQTNSKFQRGQASANQVYIATHCGFLLSRITGTNLSGAAPIPVESLLPSGTVWTANGAPSDAFQVGQQFSWDLTIGQGITRTIGPLAEYAAPGVGGSCDSFGLVAAARFAGQNGGPAAHLRKLEVPLVFPPLINVTITAQNGSPFTLLTGTEATPASVQIKMVLRGYLMTMPVG